MHFFNAGIVANLITGGSVMIPLLALCLISLTVIIERLCYWRSLRRQDVGATVLGRVADGHFEDAIRVASRSRHPVARVLHAGLMDKGHAPGTAMEAAAQAELPPSRRSLPVLDTSITLAPLLGLLGTITGMISAFGVVTEAGLGQPHAITGGVAEALIFFLLVFFMISTLSMTINRALPVNLPTAATSQKDLRENLNLTLTQEGGLFLNKEAITLPQLGPQVKAALASEPELTVILSADGEVHHSMVVEVMDELRTAGIAHLAIAVKPDKRSPP